VESNKITSIDVNDPKSFHAFITLFYGASSRTASDSRLRTYLTSQLVNEFICGVECSDFNDDCPLLSKVSLSSETAIKVEILKQFSFLIIIESPLLKLSNYRAKEIIKTIFNTLETDYTLMPTDYQEFYKSFSNAGSKKRVICDFIAGMTDAYVLEFYGRLRSMNPQTIFKPQF